MEKKIEYKTLLINGGQNGVYAEFPYDVYKEYGTRKAVRVKVSFDGIQYQMSLLPRGGGRHWIHVRKEIRGAIGKEEGDEVVITVEKDNSKRTVQIPEYLQWLLDNEPEMKKAFERISGYYKKFWIQFIEEPKNEETKVERINKMFEFLKKNKQV
jgi:hypothetical protein